VLRHYEVSAAYASDLRSRLAARDRDLAESLQTAGDLHAEADASRGEATELRRELELMTQDLETLRRRSDRLAAIEQGRWWKLHERLGRVSRP
jgi:hypothetical protein